MPIETRRVTPEIFQTVKRSLFVMKDVDDNLQIIEHDPLAGRETVNGHGPQLVILL